MPTQQPVKVSFNKPYADYLAGGYLPINSSTQLKPITNPVEVSLPERRPAELKGLSPQIFANSIFQPAEENKAETTQQLKAEATPKPTPQPQPAQQPRVITPRSMPTPTNPQLTPEAILQPSQTQLPITLPQLIQTTPQVLPTNVPLTTYPIPQSTLVPLQTPVAPLVVVPERARAYI